MVPCSCGESELILSKDANWTFDWEPGLSDRTLSVLMAAIQALGLSALLLCGFLISGILGAFLALGIGGGLVMLIRHATFRGEPVGPVRITPIGVCMRNDGQTPLRVVQYALHPLCAVVDLCAHDSQQLRYTRRLVFWRHHFPQQQYRRMTLVIRWLARGAAHE